MPSSFSTRFAPSPTGFMHLGNIRSALLGWLWAQVNGGTFQLRIEDLDSTRCRPHFTDEIFRDLEFLSLHWNGPVWHQSQRADIYNQHLATLISAENVYACTCSRSEIAKAASAPHMGEEGPIYPGTCREKNLVLQHSSAIRFRALPERVAFEDVIQGTWGHDVAECVGDFVVRKNDGVASYQLAVVVDDALSKVSHVLRGDDLLSSTPRQILLYRSLNFSTPKFAHVPLLMQPDGKRLAKRDGASTLKYLRESGVAPEVVIGKLAQWSGLGTGEPIGSIDLAKNFSIDSISKSSTVVSEDEMQLLCS